MDWEVPAPAQAPLPNGRRLRRQCAIQTRSALRPEDVHTRGANLACVRCPGACPRQTAGLFRPAQACRLAAYSSVGHAAFLTLGRVAAAGPDSALTRALSAHPSVASSKKAGARESLTGAFTLPAAAAPPARGSWRTGLGFPRSHSLADGEYPPGRGMDRTGRHLANPDRSAAEIPRHAMSWTSRRGKAAWPREPWGSWMGEGRGPSWILASYLPKIPN